MGSSTFITFLFAFIWLSQVFSFSWHAGSSLKHMVSLSFLAVVFFQLLVAAH